MIRASAGKALYSTGFNDHVTHSVHAGSIGAPIFSLHAYTSTAQFLAHLVRHDMNTHKNAKGIHYLNAHEKRLASGLGFEAASRSSVEPGFSSPGWRVEH